MPQSARIKMFYPWLNHRTEKMELICRINGFFAGSWKSEIELLFSFWDKTLSWTVFRTTLPYKRSVTIVPNSWGPDLKTADRPHDTKVSDTSVRRNIKLPIPCFCNLTSYAIELKTTRQIRRLNYDPINGWMTIKSYKWSIFYRQSSVDESEVNFNMIEDFLSKRRKSGVMISSWPYVTYPLFTDP